MPDNFHTSRRIAPLDLLFLLIILTTIAYGTFLIYQAVRPAQVIATEAEIPIVTELNGQPVEPINNADPVSRDNPQAIRDELLVIIPNKADTAQFGGKIKRIDGLPEDTYKLTVDGSGTLAEKQAEVSSKQGVESADPNYVYFATEPPQPPPNKKPIAKFNRWQWGVDKINARYAWNITKGSGITVAVLDTGVRGDHVEFKDGLRGPHKTFFPPGMSEEDAEGYACRNRGDPLHDSEGHGTAVASIITAAGDRYGMAGIAPDTKIMAVQVLNCAGRGTADATAQGIRHAVDSGAHVINMSLGAYGGYGCANAEVKAIEYAVSKNVVVVASSGNERYGSIGCPARIPGVIAVGAINRDGSIVANTSWGSSWGKQQSVMAPGIHVAVAASHTWGEWRKDGKVIGTSYVGDTNNYYRLKFNGTSAAAPFVAGTAALVRSINPKLTPAQVKDIIQKTATSPGPHAGGLPNSTYGYGIVNAYEAAAYTKHYYSNTGGR